MKDVAALCRRVVIIAQGRIIYDGSLAGIVDRFGGHKVISLQLADGQMPGDLGRYGEVLSVGAAAGEAARRRAAWCPRCSAAILAHHAVEDVSVEDPPLEEVIAEMFSPGRRRRRTATSEAAKCRAAAASSDVRSHLHLVDDPADQPRRAAGLSGRLRAGHADALPADRHPDLPLGGRVLGDRAPPAAASEIAGYSYHDIIAYYLLTMISRAFSSMPGLASGIARDIRDGTVKKYLIQPIDMLGFLLLYRDGPQAGLLRRGRRCRSRWCSTSAAATFPAGPTPRRLLAFLASLVMAFLLGFFLEATLGMIGFWFLEVSSLLFVYMLFSFFFSGHMFPHRHAAGHLGRRWCELIPLQYLAYFPAAVFLGKITGAGAGLGPGGRSSPGWCSSSSPPRLAFRCGVRRYSGYGG